MTSGKAKGSLFERNICKQLSRWVTRGKKEDVFWRSAMSGGRATRAASQGKDLSRQAGDICAVAPEGHDLTNVYYIECKHYRDLAIDSFFIKQSGILTKFWLKTVKEARKYKKSPMLIAKQNNMPTLVILAGDSDNISDHYAWIVHPKFRCMVMHFDEMTRGPFRRG